MNNDQRSTLVLCRTASHHPMKDKREWTRETPLNSNIKPGRKSIAAFCACTQQLLRAGKERENVSGKSGQLRRRLLAGSRPAHNRFAIHPVETVKPHQATVA